VAVSFGTPVSVRAWLANEPSGLLELPKQERLPHMQRLADHAMERIGQVVPITPVPLAAATLLSFGSASLVRRNELFERMDEIRDRLAEFNAKIVRRELPVEEVWNRAWLMFQMRRLVISQGDEFIILPNQRPLLEYYANSIRHLLPQEVVVCLSPVDEADPSLPRLASREELDIMTREIPTVKSPRR
jgi:glycerol-3-phosphate O-acyltransferase